MAINTSAYKNPSDENATYILIAYFLNWAAEKHPEKFFKNSAIARAIFGRTSSLNEQKVNSAKYNATVYLMEHFGRGHVPDRKLGIRATTGYDDMIAHTYTSQVQRAARANRKASVTAAHIDVKRLNPANRKFFLTTKAQFHLDSANVNAASLERLLAANND